MDLREVSPSTFSVGWAKWIKLISCYISMKNWMLFLGISFQKKLAPLVCRVNSQWLFQQLKQLEADSYQHQDTGYERLN